MGIFVLLFPFVQLSYAKVKSQALHEEAQSLFIPSDVAQKVTEDPHAVTKTRNVMSETEPINKTFERGLYPEPAPNLANKPKIGEIIGVLSIPNLDIKEAILEGTSQKELAKAPGHLPDSVFPGQIGTSIIAAHNSSSFRHLDQLTEGMNFTITTEQGVFTFSVTGQRILAVDDVLPNMSYPAVALETCYPLDALYLTDKRLFVEAALIKSEIKKDLTLTNVE